jgi:hypothetical protein
MVYTRNNKKVDGKKTKKGLPPRKAKERKEEEKSSNKLQRKQIKKQRSL